jgi:hypothetical protein
VSAQKIAGLTDSMDVPQNCVIDAQGRKLTESVSIRCIGCADQVRETMDRIAAAR